MERNDKEIKKEEMMNKVSKSICKIITSKNAGLGFLIKLYKGNNSFYCLMTNENLIKREMIELKEKIEIYYDKESVKLKINLNKEERYIKDFIYLDLDLIIIEIIKEDNINEEIFLLPDMEYKNGYKEYENKGIFIPQYLEEGGKITYSKGKIKTKNNCKFSHLATTKNGASGSPIFLEGTIKVVGIDKRDNKINNESYGNFIYPIIESLKNNLKYDKKYYGKDIYEGEFKNDKHERNGKKYL